MASTSDSQSSIQDDDDQEEEIEHFDDFTLASSWERFISEIEAVCRQWLATGPKNLVKKDAVCLDFSKNIYKVRSELKYAMKNYSMEYYFEPFNDGKVADWISTSHDLQQSFGVKDFLVIAPQSASGVVLDAPEASKLLSAVSIAMSNSSSLWPAFVPVHDPSRRAYIGIQNMGTIFTRRFEADRIGSQVPIKLMHLEGLYELFVSKFAYSTVDLSMHLFKVHFRMKLTYRTLPTDDDPEVQQESEFLESGRHSEFETHNKIQWDDDCPWSEWYSAEDPVKGLELLTIWSERTVDTSLVMAELENASPLEADKWFIFPNLSPYLETSDGSTIGFASQLRLLVNALDSSLGAQFMEDFVSAVENSGSDNMKSSAVIPPPTVLDRVLKDLFHEDAEVKLDFADAENKNSRAIKGAPLESLFAQFCLHALWFGNCNIRAIAVLWIEFVREIRWCWEESQPLPRMPTNGTVDLSTCLIYQKLHMLAICIEKKHQENKEHPDVGDKKTSPYIEGKAQITKQSSSLLEVTEDSSGERDSLTARNDLGSHGVATSLSNSEQQNFASPTDTKLSEYIRMGSAGVVGSTMLLNSCQQMHAPFTQDPPLMTEDMHEERLKAVEAFGDSFSFSAQLEKEILSSDMSAFKAANPDAVFEDFIRWHSPRDWENDDNGKLAVSQAKAGEVSKNEWPPRGRLSERMSDHGSSWRKIWNEAPSLPAFKQKPLLDPNREGEKVLHYLETMRPHQLLEQMVCTAFRAAADTLNRTAFGGLKLMTSKLGQLYLTMASTLKSLQRNSLSVDSEIIEDLTRLCVIFEHVEKLLTVAASLHRKFLQAPRLSEAIFSDFYNFYLPKMGTGSGSHDIDKSQEFTKKQQIMAREKEVVASMFTPPTANQSWRKVLSLGNLLNGHEPILREIIFSKRDHVSGGYYAGSYAGGYPQEIETYRMYLCGTSNDLRVALAVASCD
ncbi:rab3 GTPase-activating protein catalytic subunit isoform X1 [Coffea eugenioides]|uniref:rab3 GTPase-activating protein catalytic subunit isoform X1 n=1 Tax=Coffea eugenioides TaxID=49369 RepID=UPI000F60E213|nr:rab3 GTPase-activating protein catalytic subunit isoform X1 [Coffea eugenioides]XP_027176011.1 rab3 GTPase-activating protein catalytic subunit isoform X1 [Coffea eugenioides]XP_027176019.1 rab3 GTPase-activating protein catalytic subunit isoform X1 [Coffea eugenioides]